MDDATRAFDAAWIGDWLRRQGVWPARVVPLPGDVSPRRYARVLVPRGPSLILALYPPELVPACGRFLHTSELLASGQIPVPAILASDCPSGLMLLEDLGDQTLFDLKVRRWSELEPYFESGLELIRRIAALNARRVAALNPALDPAALSRELDQTWRLFLEPRGLTGGPRRTAKLRQILQRVCASLGDAGSVPCHRDFMARNLIPLPGQSRLAVLDHQDLRLGPPTYDLASLLNDSLFPPSQMEERLLEQQGLSPTERLDYHRAALQRTLKAIGTFVAFSQRGSRRHLPLIPGTLDRSLYHLRQLPEAAEIVPEVEPLWLAVANP